MLSSSYTALRFINRRPHPQTKTWVCWNRGKEPPRHINYRTLYLGCRPTEKTCRALRNAHTLRWSNLQTNRILSSVYNGSKLLSWDNQYDNSNAKAKSRSSLSLPIVAPFQSNRKRADDYCCNNGFSIFSMAPYKCQHADGNIRAFHPNYMVLRTFMTSNHNFGRHRTSCSAISSCPGFLDSQTWKKHEHQSGLQRSVDNPSSIFKINRNYSKIDRRISNIRKSISDHNKNIKEKIMSHRTRGVKAVKKLRRKLETQKEDIKTIPNLLTTIRMASAPVLAYLVVNDYFGCALSIFVLAGITDMLDGYIARNFKNQRTAFGTALDPLADKLLMCFLTLSLTSANLIPVPLTVLILSRDAGLILASFVIRYKSLSPPKTLARFFDPTRVTAKLFPSNISKVNTAVQLTYVACVLASPVFDFVDHPLLKALMYTTAATTFLSGLDYVITWRRRLKIVKNK